MAWRRGRTGAADRVRSLFGRDCTCANGERRSVLHCRHFCFILESRHVEIRFARPPRCDLYLRGLSAGLGRTATLVSFLLERRLGRPVRLQGKMCRRSAAGLSGSGANLHSTRRRTACSAGVTRSSACSGDGADESRPTKLLVRPVARLSGRPDTLDKPRREPAAASIPGRSQIARVLTTKSCRPARCGRLRSHRDRLGCED